MKISILGAARTVTGAQYLITVNDKTILLVSYQAPHTLRRALANGDTQVKIMGKVYSRKAEVCMISGLSEHAGQEFLVEYAMAVKDQALQEKGKEKVYYPFMRQVMEL